jgi:DNA repair exonuclease SbcCD ATPase subunit
MHGHANTWQEELQEVCAERDELRAMLQRSGRDLRIRQAEVETLRRAEGAFLAEVARLTRNLAEIRALVDRQAEDEALWFLGLDGHVPITEAYLQQELRRLHDLIEHLTHD